MEKTKKLFAAVIVFMAAVFALYSQTTANNQTSNQISEETIIISDDAVSENSTTAQTYKGPSTVGMFVRMIVVLIIVVGLIYGVFWFIKKKTNIVKTDDEYLRRAAYINIAPGKSVEVITLIDKAYLIGVTEDNITLLGEIHDEELIKAMNLTADKKNNTKKPASFSDVLDMFLIKKGGQKNVFTDTEQQVDNLFSNTGKTGIDEES
ncbi:flagellar protein FliO/FliZ [Treponema bryantii]|uniref:Flagellar protein FliO/FliZ n=1 Tax=Treponema bryantii TaxID=163 RepID=A0A1H9J0R7_9SPIR|nr:flagellar biosynthetic protein FliO [Treponema bryantii]BDC93249.1 flagellar protein [Treponema bryantii]SEQ80433.1 flagellar protein FliO/FliZ [Treponema bryantii]